MKLISSVQEMQAYSHDLRKAGKTISFVPTMGYLHEGHLTLMREGRKMGDCLIISIYVNPTQFGVNEDFAAYPRDRSRDAQLAEGVGVDVIFCPENNDMYPQPYHTFIDVEGLTKNLCGLSRPGHFRGVATVCCKLFNIVQPHWAIFGKKDFQQLVIIRQMVRDLNLTVQIVGLPIVREKDGLAMSSRNVYLKEAERKAALSLSRALLIAKKLYDEGVRDCAPVLKAVRGRLSEEPLLSVEYATICDVQKLDNLHEIGEKAVLAIAVRVGSTRLIDNYVFGDPLPL